MTTVYICIPVYNVRGYLAECLNSVFAQTYESICVICVDDGSTDGSSAILADYGTRYSKDRLSIISKPNGGLSSARNACLDYVQGRDGYIYFLDSDDFIEPSHIEKLVTAAEKKQFDIVCSSFCFYSGSSKRPFHGMDGVFGEYNSAAANRLLLEDLTIQSHAPAKLYKASLWRKIRFPEEIRFMEDQATTFRVFYLAKEILFLKEYGYCYRQRPESLLSSGNATNKAVSALNAYALPLDYDFGKYSLQEQKAVVDASAQAYAACFLMMFPRYHAKNADSQLKKQFKNHVMRVKKLHLIKNYRPQKKAERYKRFAFLYLRPFYCLLYAIFGHLSY